MTEPDKYLYGPRTPEAQFPPNISTILSVYGSHCVSVYKRARGNTTFSSVGELEELPFTSRYGVASNIELISRNQAFLLGDNPEVNASGNISYVSDSPTEALEKMMNALSRLQEKHGWTDEYAYSLQKPVHGGLEEFVPSAETPFELTGNTVLSLPFWEQFTDIYDKVFTNIGTFYPFNIDEPELPDLSQYAARFGHEDEEGNNLYYSKLLLRIYRMLIFNIQTSDIYPALSPFVRSKAGHGVAYGSVDILGPRVTECVFRSHLIPPTVGDYWVFPISREDPPPASFDVEALRREAVEAALTALDGFEFVSLNQASFSMYVKNRYLGYEVDESIYVNQTNTIIGNLKYLREETYWFPGGYGREQTDVYYEPEYNNLVDGFPVIGRANFQASANAWEYAHICGFHMKKDGIRFTTGVEEINDLICNIGFGGRFYFPPNVEEDNTRTLLQGVRKWVPEESQSYTVYQQHYVREPVIETGILLGTLAEDELFERYEFDTESIANAEATGTLEDLPDMLSSPQDVDFVVWIRIKYKAFTEEPVITAPNSSSFTSGTLLYGGKFTRDGGPGHGLLMSTRYGGDILAPFFFDIPDNIWFDIAVDNFKLEDYDENIEGDRLYVSPGSVFLSVPPYNIPIRNALYEEVGQPPNISFAIS